ncbi:unnamed protein product [Nippostrongylus brasiliensis]|uniref:SCP domain-containing protein n=1 Tax=Nippostrongylus brasiliensis TaxID=27835 RepID=A0A0N4YBS4_NIPBR|nr:unnamed protein product [Nippostrongylus brasiliensis]
MKYVQLVLWCLIPYGSMATADNSRCEILGSLRNVYTKYISPINRGLIYNTSLEELALNFRSAENGYFQRLAEKSDQEKVDSLFGVFLQSSDVIKIRNIPGGHPYGCNTRKCSTTGREIFRVGCIFTTKGFSLAEQFSSTFETFFKGLNSKMAWDNGLYEKAVTLLTNMNLAIPSNQIKRKVQTSLLSVDEGSIGYALTNTLLPYTFTDGQLTKIKNQGSHYGCAMRVIYGKLLDLACIVGLGELS